MKYLPRQRSLLEHCLCFPLVKVLWVYARGQMPLDRSLRRVVSPNNPEYLWMPSIVRDEHQAKEIKTWELCCFHQHWRISTELSKERASGMLRYPVMSNQHQLLITTIKICRIIILELLHFTQIFFQTDKFQVFSKSSPWFPAKFQVFWFTYITIVIGVFVPVWHSWASC